MALNTAVGTWTCVCARGCAALSHGGAGCCGGRAGQVCPQGLPSAPSRGSVCSRAKPIAEGGLSQVEGRDTDDRWPQSWLSLGPGAGLRTFQSLPFLCSVEISECHQDKLHDRSLYLCGRQTPLSVMTPHPDEKEATASRSPFPERSRRRGKQSRGRYQSERLVGGVPSAALRGRDSRECLSVPAGISVRQSRPARQGSLEVGPANANAIKSRRFAPGRSR